MTAPRDARSHLEEQFAKIRGRPFVVVTDTHFADTYEAYCDLGGYLRDANIPVVLVTECARAEQENVIPIHIEQVPPGDAVMLQQRYPFSLFKPLACERSLTDYCTFRMDEVYSDLPLETFLDRYTRFINTYEFLFSQGGVFLGMLHDTFKSALASRIAAHHGRPVLLPIQYYWWPDGMLFYDTPLQGARELQRRYQEYRANPKSIDRKRAEAIYAAKGKTFISRAESGNGLADMVGNIWRSRTSPEPFSYRNFARRRLRRLRERWSGGFSGIDFITDATAVKGDFLVYPMHVAPEASILGGAPEFADQFSLIKNVSLNLPLGTTLIVKEHPDQMRARLGARFYQEVASLPNVRIAHASVPAMALIRSARCRGVVVINGTLGLEAAFEGKRVFIPSRDAAWYSFCDAFDVVERCEDLFALLQSGEESNRLEAITALFLAMDDCVERIPGPPAGEYTFREAGTAIMRAIAAKLQTVVGATP